MVVLVEWLEMGVIHPWQPIVHPDKIPDKTAISLIEHSKALVVTHSKSRIEVWLPLDSDGAKRFRPTYVSWYRACGFRPVGREYHVQSGLPELSADDFRFP